MYVFESELCLNQLTEQEKKARDIMVYLFNPVLKYILANSNPKEFARYGFNSCRQTAILGAAYIQKLLPGYDIMPYEGLFIEKLPNGNIEQYIHAFILASKNNRRLLIDLSRTTKRLMFSEVLSSLYPSIEDYKDMIFISSNPINLNDVIYNDEPEYFTKKSAVEILEMIDIFINILQQKEQTEKDMFCDTIYNLFTQLRR